MFSQLFELQFLYFIGGASCVYIFWLLIAEYKENNKNFNVFLISIWALPLFMSGVSYFIPSFSTPVFGSANRSDTLVIFTQISLGLRASLKSTAFGKGHRTESKVRFYNGIPIFSALIALIYGALTLQGWLQPLYCLLLFSVVLLQKITLKEIQVSTLFALLMAFAVQMAATIDGGLDACRADKCLVSKNILPSELGGNGFGIRLFLLSTVLIVTLAGVKKFSVALFSLYFIVLSGSRTGVVSFIVVLSLTSILGFLRRSRQIRVLKASILILLLGSTIPFLSEFDERSLTRRGLLWQRGRELFYDSPLIGWGPSYWVRLNGETSYAANNGVHNIWLDAAVALGVLGLLLNVAWLIAIFVKIEKHHVVIGPVLLGTLAAASVESVFSFWTFGFGIPVIVTITLLLNTITDSRELDEFQIANDFVSRSSRLV
jgi:O-antigen ligase